MDFTKILKTCEAALRLLRVLVFCSNTVLLTSPEEYRLRVLLLPSSFTVSRRVPCKSTTFTGFFSGFLLCSYPILSFSCVLYCSSYLSSSMFSTWLYQYSIWYRLISAITLRLTHTTTPLRGNSPINVLENNFK